jgi:hypothetical protein
MPVSIQAMREGQAPDALSKRVYEFLTSHPGTGYTADEIAVEVGVVKSWANTAGPLQLVGRALMVGSIQNMLTRWAQKGIIEMAMVEGSQGFSEQYFSAKQDSSGVSW